MNIAIIGTGNIGAGLARVLSAAGNTVVVSDRKGGAEAADKLKAQGVGVASADIASAVHQSEVVVLALPYTASLEISAVADFSNKIVIDVSNPVTDDFSALQIGHDTSAAEAIAASMPSARVVKAFNTVFAEHYAGDLTIAGNKIQTFVASDDEDAQKQVIALSQSAGFDARSAGKLANARYLEPLGYMNIQFGYMLGQGTSIAPQWVAA